MGLGVILAIFMGGASAAIGGVVPDAPEVGKAQIVFFRKGGWMGSALSCAVHENGIRLTSLPPGRFAIVQVEPGVHEFGVSRNAKNTLHLEMTPGETYYANCNIGIGPSLSPSGRMNFGAILSRLKPVEREKMAESEN